MKDRGHPAENFRWYDFLGNYFWGTSGRGRDFVCQVGLDGLGCVCNGFRPKERSLRNLCFGP